MDCSTDAQIRRALNNLPEDLAGTYERCLQRVRENESEYSLRVLRYVYGARNPLNILALGEALATDPETGEMSAEDVPSTDSIMDSGANLVILSEIDNFVLPAHHSVRQFLESSESEILRDLSLPIWDDAALDLGEMSVTHLWWHDHISATEKPQKQAPSEATTHDIMVPAISRMRSWIPRSKTLQLFEKMSSLKHKISEPVFGENLPPITITLPSLNRHLIAMENPFHHYAKLNWLTLTQTLTPTSAKWDCFRDLVLSPKVADSSYPWLPTTHERVSGLVYLRHVLQWAIVNHHAALLVLIGEEAPSNKDERYRLFNSPLPGSGDLLPIHLAAKVASASTVDMLSNLCDLTVTCRLTGRDVLFFAAERDCPEVFDLLLRHDSRLSRSTVDHAGKNFFEAATDAGLLTPWLIERQAKLGSFPPQGTPFLLHAVKISRKPAIDSLLSPEHFLTLRSDEIGDLDKYKYNREVLSWLLQHRLAQGIHFITRHGASLDMDIEVSNFKQTGYTKVLCAPIFHALINKDANFAIELTECGASLSNTLSLNAYRDTREPFSIGLRPIDLALILGWQDMAACIIKKASNTLPNSANLTMSQTRTIVIDILRPLSRIVWMSFLVETMECKIVTVGRRYRSSWSSRDTPPTTNQERYWWAAQSNTSHRLGGTRITLSSKRELEGGISFTLMVGFCERGASMRDTISTTARMTTLDSVTVSSQDYDLQHSLSPQPEIRGVNIMRGRIDC